MHNPYLFRFREKCTSPRRASVEASYVYSLELDMVLDIESHPPLLAIESKRHPGPITKKKDIEKGEDAKDRRMW